MREIIISVKEANQRLDKYLQKYLDLSPKGFCYKMMRKKNITLNGKKAVGSEILQKEDRIKLFLSEETIIGFQKQRKKTEKKPEKALPKLKIVLETADILILDKPSNLLSQKAKESDYSINEMALDYLIQSEKLSEEELRNYTPSVCNRLDRNTSGLITVGKTLQGAQYLSRVLKTREVHKYYLCIVKGKITQAKVLKGFLSKDEKRNVSVISSKKTSGAAEIETHYWPVCFKNGHTLLEILLVTGKSHQIRAHLSGEGHPIVGDCKYGGDYLPQGQLLHAWCMEFPDGKQVHSLPPKAFGRFFPDCTKEGYEQEILKKRKEWSA